MIKRGISIMVMHMTFNHHNIGSNLIYPKKYKSPYSSMVELDTVNIMIDVRFILGAYYNKEAFNKGILA